MTTHTLLDFGIYRVGQTSYLNKLEAILAAAKSNIPATWDFNEEFFSKAHWAVEPTVSIEELYARRARELREKYDYLVLHLSGGWDSGNILETCLTHNIEIDEIITRGPLPDNFDPSDLSAKNCYAECLIAALPKAQAAKKIWPNLTITVADTKQIAIDYFSKNSDWIFKTNQLHVGCHRNDLDLLSKSAMSAAEAGKRVGHILGIDKPRIYLNNGRYEWKFLDGLVINHINPRLSSVDLPLNVELFYWAPTPAACDIMIKQGHLMKRFYKNHNINPNQLAWNRQTHDAAARVIYPSIAAPTWSADKASMIPEWDHWFYADKGSKHFTNWKNGLEYIAKILPEQYRSNIAMVGFFSGGYDLGP